MTKKPQPEAPKPRMLARDWLAEQTGTDPADWEEVLSGTEKYRKGYRYRNRKTNQWAKRPNI